MNISDEICEENGLSVIKNPERSKGKSLYEWDMVMLICETLFLKREKAQRKFYEPKHSYHNFN